MTHDDAVARAAALNADAGADEHWLVRADAAQAWEVVRLKGKGLGVSGPSGSHVESRPKPEQPADTRPSIFQNVPPFGPG